MNNDPYSPPGSSVQVEDKSTTLDDHHLNSDLAGIRGWLILVAIAVIVAPIRTSLYVFPLYVGLFKDGTWEILTTPGTEAFSPFWAPTLIGEMFINSILVITWVYICILFFTKRTKFPGWYIGILVFTVFFIIIDAAIVKLLLLPDEPMLDPETTKELVRSIVAMAIWIPYMLVSKRVKATFVN